MREAELRLREFVEGVWTEVAGSSPDTAANIHLEHLERFDFNGVEYGPGARDRGSKALGITGNLKGYDSI